MRAPSEAKTPRVRVPALAALAAVALTTGCVTTAEQGRRMQSRIDALEVRLDEQKTRLEAEAAAIAGQLDQLTRRLAELRQDMESVGLAARRSGADVNVTVEMLRQELMALRGRIEELSFHQGKVREDLAALADDTDKKVAALGGDEKLEAYEAKKEAERIEKPQEPAAFLSLAKKRLESGEHVVARQLLNDFLRKWPKDGSADEAQFLLAESYLGQKDHRAAILEFNKVRERYPESRRVPDSLLRLGESFAALDLKPEAGQFLDALIKKYPKSAAAKKARARKKELGIK